MDELFLEKAELKKANMFVTLILPWTVMWYTTSFSNYWGGILTVLACLVTIFMTFRYRFTTYDRVGLVTVGVCGLLSITGILGGLLTVVSYVAFGLIWALSCLFHLPLTAYYSQDIGKLKIPLVLKTHRILTFLWGVLFVLTAVWTYFIAVYTRFGMFLFVLNTGAPILMGFFTRWFKKWYPARMLRLQNAQQVQQADHA